MKKIFVVLIVMVMFLSLVPKPVTASDPWPLCDLDFCVESITLSYKVMQNGKYSYLGEVKIVELDMQPVKGATVTSAITIRYPDNLGYGEDLTAVTNPKGLAVYRLIKPAGISFGLCVMKIEKDGTVVDFGTAPVCKIITIP